MKIENLEELIEDFDKKRDIKKLVIKITIERTEKEEELKIVKIKTKECVFF